jgi:molecular chaperone DnaK (HSP70)
MGTMVRLGIDLGTTRTVVAAVDRGNYPVLGFVTPEGDLVDHYPTVTAEVGGELVHGFRAVTAARGGAPWLGSWKRLFSDHGAQEVVTIGSARVTLCDLATSFLASLREDILTTSNLPTTPTGPLEVMISVPANSHSTQRFLTIEAFRGAGFDVRGMLNEPSAAGLEYAHRHKATINSRREHVIIYDLGGGTFDAALVLIAGGHHDVIATSGIARLGGDDFDAVLLDFALETAGVKRSIGPAERRALMHECRAAKEAIHPNSRRIVLDLVALDPTGMSGGVTVGVSEYYERVRALVDRSMEALDPVLRAQTADAQGEGITEAELAGIYVVGGASGLPLVPRVLRERFGRRVHRSTYPSAAIAIGLAIAADAGVAVPVREHFTRHLGVFRERDRGAHVSFDRIFEKGTPMPGGGEPPLMTSRVYRAAHDLGHFRFVECGALDSGGGPCGDITPHAEIRFPFARELRGAEGLGERTVQRLPGEGPRIEEKYEVDAAGVIAVTITDLDAGYAERHVL